MNILFDYFGNPEAPNLTLCYLDNTPVSPILDPSDISMSFEFLSPNEISFRAYAYYTQNGERIQWAYYDQLDVYKQVFVEGSGYYVITQASETREVDNPYKDITAMSCEISLGYKDFVLEEGSYLLYNPSNPTDSDTVLGKVMAKIPNWKLGSVDESLNNITRFLDEAEGNMYDFLRNTVEDRYACLFQFDIMNHIISVIDQNRSIEKTQLYLSYDNFINNISIDRTNDQIVTALRATGGDGISIDSVNPIGGSIIYQFDYFQNDMPDGLWDAVVEWKQKIANNQQAFSNAVLQVQKINAEIAQYEQEKIVLESQKATYEQIIELRKESGLDYADVQESLDETVAQIQDVVNQIDAKEQDKQVYQTQYQNIQSNLAFKNNFTSEQILQLDPFIIYGEFQDDNIITTDNMSYEDKQKQCQQLYDRCVKTLADTLINKGSFDVDSQNFLFENAFKPHAEELKLGAQIYVEDKFGAYTPYLLVNYNYSYENNNLSLSFNNLGTAENSLDTYAKLYGRLNKTTSLIQNSLSSKVDSNIIDQLYDDLKDIKGQAEAILQAGELTVKRIITEYISVQNAKTPGATIIDGGNITTGTIDAELVKIINLIVNHLQSDSGDFHLEAWAAVLDLYYKTYPRLRMYCVDPSADANAPGIYQCFSGNVNDSGDLLDSNARYSYLSPGGVGAGQDRSGEYNGTVNCAEVSAERGASIGFPAYSRIDFKVFLGTDGYYDFEFLCEQTGEQRPILRSKLNGVAFLGTTGYRWNTGYFTNTITQSDLKDKENISVVPNAKAFVMGLSPISYTLKDGDSGRTHMGFGAQDVAKLAKECNMGDLALYQAGVIDEEGNESYYDSKVPDERLSWGLNYHEFIAPIVATIQEQQKEIEALKKEINEIKAGMAG